MNTYNVTNYNVQIHAEASNPAPYEAFIGLNLVARDSQPPATAVAFLNFYPDATSPLPENVVQVQGGSKVYGAYFRVRWYPGILDLLRNESRITFWFDEATKEAILGTTTAEPVGEGNG